jgi:2-methylisocitrate lyase-like PEP mutase family enzyme
VTSFRDLHAGGLFVMPNPWDVGSATILASLGFPALATTSSGHAASLGRPDQQVTLDELVDHAAAVVAAVDVPVNVDAEHLFSRDVAGIGPVVRRIAATGAAGLSIEDYDPATESIEPIGVAAERVAAAADAARREGLVLTARAENLLYGAGDLEDTVMRLVAYRDAGAEVVYAPGLVDLAEITAVVAEVGVPVNVLALAHGPSIAELAAAGVARVSTGGALARAAYAELRRLATDLRAHETRQRRTP